jgi:hypothetical protein
MESKKALIFAAERCHIGHDNCYVIENLCLSARGKVEYDEREQTLFSNAKSDE